MLEFLVRHCEIHQYNFDAIIAIIVGYYEPTWFVRMVRILYIRETRWEFRLPVEAQGTPLLWATLVQHAIDD